MGLSEFLEFEVRPDGRLRYANVSSYKSGISILRELRLASLPMAVLSRLILDHESLLKLSDEDWPYPSRNSRMEIEVIHCRRHLTLCSRILVKEGCSRAGFAFTGM